MKEIDKTENEKKPSRSTSKYSLSFLFAFLLTTVITAYLMRDSVRDFLIVPLLYFLELLERFFDTFSQGFIWVTGFILAILVVFEGLLGARWQQWVYRKERENENSAKKEEERFRWSTSVTELKVSIHLASSNQYSHEMLAKQLGELLLKRYGHSTPNSSNLEEFLKTRRKEIPEDVSRFLESWLNRHKLVFSPVTKWRHLFRPTIAPFQRDPQELENVISFLEEEWNPHNEEWNLQNGK